MRGRSRHGLSKVRNGPPVKGRFIPAGFQLRPNPQPRSVFTPCHQTTLEEPRVVSRPRVRRGAIGQLDGVKEITRSGLVASVDGQSPASRGRTALHELLRERPDRSPDPWHCWRRPSGRQKAGGPGLATRSAARSAPSNEPLMNSAIRSAACAAAPVRSRSADRRRTALECRPHARTPPRPHARKHRARPAHAAGTHPSLQPARTNRTFRQGGPGPSRSN